MASSSASSSTADGRDVAASPSHPYAKVDVPKATYVIHVESGERVYFNSKRFKAARDAGEIAGMEPKPADGETVTIKAPRPGKPPKVDKELVKTATRAVAAAEYGVILGAFFASLGAATQHRHWTLAESEQKLLGDAVAGVMPTLPARYTKAMAKASPWIKLSLVGAQIVGPRVIMSQSMIATAKNAPDAAATTPEEVRDATSASPNGRAHAPHVSPDGASIVFPTATN